MPINNSVYIAPSSQQVRMVLPLTIAINASGVVVCSYHSNVHQLYIHVHIMHINTCTCTHVHVHFAPCSLRTSCPPHFTISLMGTYTCTHTHTCTSHRAPCTLQKSINLPPTWHIVKVVCLPASHHRRHFRNTGSSCEKLRSLTSYTELHIHIHMPLVTKPCMLQCRPAMYMYMYMYVHYIQGIWEKRVEIWTQVGLRGRRITIE